MEMKKIILTFFIIFFVSGNLSAQLAPKSRTVNGVVYNQKNGGATEVIPFATVYWLESGTYVDCDVDGKFTFTVFEKAEEATLVATAIGFNTDTVAVNYNTENVEFFLKGVNELEKAVVMARQEGSYLSRMTPVKTEVITAAGLCKMACCNLAESFENSASVTVGYSDAITGAKQIRLLGLSGIYTAMLDENRPAMRGLASPFGLSYVPGQWLESIQIAKGPSSVVNGLEAITGQINMEHRKPTDEKPLFINLFVDNHLMTEANIASSLQLNEKWSTVTLGHYSSMPMGHDGNGDGFKDEPTSLKFNLANRWLYYDQSGLQVRFGVRALTDDRTGGATGFKKEMRKDISSMVSNNIWGSNINNKGVNAFVKVGLPLNVDQTRSLAFVADYTYHQIDSYFGLKEYNGRQNSVFANFIYQDEFGEHHRINAGIRNQFDLFDETLLDQYIISNDWKGNTYNLDRRENAIGIYGEYTYNLGDKFTAVAGVSLDYNNLHGFLLAPRANIKYAFTDDIIFRASGGRGYRSPNVVVDNIGMLSTGREISIAPNLDMEDAWTYGGNITGYLPIGENRNSYLSFDYFRTDFNRQIVVDQEFDLSKVSIYNLDGKSFTNTYQFDFSIEPIERFIIIATYRYTDAKVTLAGQGLVERPMTSRYKGVLNLQYATRMSIWTFDFTAQLNGPCKLPAFMVENGVETSPAYPVLFAQITRKFRGVDVYIGGENLTNYKQKNPIIGWENPYSSEFNASQVWGPILGWKVYAGMRFTLWKK